ncbi:hypothetical protein HRI_001052900 [Hibiscus trionum]|uniref:Tetrapyrrole biosynthesis glutamyl-tRNA reductase dimerisation domain-containing protein n=1 Tax=Hibiscus trionum TaxID=183268 RepID=A0A9W7LS05_HIBTR|nr:hypothetical protein HRI_001052900 [Hibiscus trionum]
MALLPIPCSIKLHTKSNPFPIPRLVSDIHQSHTIPFISSALKTSYESKSLDRFINNDSFLQLRRGQGQGRLSANQTLETKQNDETLEREVEIVMCRVRGVVEKFMEAEIQKINGRLKGTSEEDKLLVEKMSREIADKILKRPLEYLKASGSNGDFESRLNDLDLLIRMLQNSCSGCQS